MKRSLACSQSLTIGPQKYIAVDLSPIQGDILENSLFMGYSPDTKLKIIVNNDDQLIHTYAKEHQSLEFLGYICLEEIDSWLEWSRDPGFIELDLESRVSQLKKELSLTRKLYLDLIRNYGYGAYFKYHRQIDRDLFAIETRFIRNNP